MCLAMPMKVIEILPDSEAIAELGGVRRKVSLKLLPDVGIGDFVLIHAGFAIGKVDEESARETIDVLGAGVDFAACGDGYEEGKTGEEPGDAGPR
jgi:hydrogenase expression/formation protein HypC